MTRPREVVAPAGISLPRAGRGGLEPAWSGSKPDRIAASSRGWRCVPVFRLPATSHDLPRGTSGTPVAVGRLGSRPAHPNPKKGEVDREGLEPPVTRVRNGCFSAKLPAHWCARERRDRHEERTCRECRGDHAGDDAAGTTPAPDGPGSPGGGHGRDPGIDRPLAKGGLARRSGRSRARRESHEGKRLASAWGAGIPSREPFRTRQKEFSRHVPISR